MKALTWLIAGLLAAVAGIPFAAALVVTAVLASFATADRVPRGTQRIMTRLHTPDRSSSGVQPSRSV